ncbi:MAG: alpha/beta hydrolase [Hyphomicrobiaceae bacterium]
MTFSAMLRRLRAPLVAGAVAMLVAACAGAGGGPGGEWPGGGIVTGEPTAGTVATGEAAPAEEPGAADVAVAAVPAASAKARTRGWSDPTLPGVVEGGAVPGQVSGKLPGDLAAKPEVPNHTVVRVWYATDRNKESSDGVLPVAYGTRRGRLAYGHTDVAIPAGHRVGALEAPSIWRLEWRENPDRHVVLLEVVEEARSRFLADVKATIARSPRRSALVFVHGYNVSFADAARRTAQMSYDLGFDGAPVFYSWPSQASLSGYAIDENNVNWTASDLKLFLKEFASQSGAENIFVIAHSLGSRALAEAIGQIASEAPRTRARFKEIILAAPDIDAEIFTRDIVPRIATPEQSVTLYMSSNDKALVASRKFHGYVRAGDATKGILVANGIDTIDSTDAEADFTGHFYYAESPSILADLRGLILDRKRPGDRAGLAFMESPIGRYWRLVPQTVRSAAAGSSLSAVPAVGDLVTGTFSRAR